jgi:hypothetical protein
MTYPNVPKSLGSNFSKKLQHLEGRVWEFEHAHTMYQGFSYCSITGRITRWLRSLGENAMAWKYKTLFLLQGWRASKKILLVQYVFLFK